MRRPSAAAVDVALFLTYNIVTCTRSVKTYVFELDTDTDTDTDYLMKRVNFSVHYSTYGIDLMVPRIVPVLFAILKKNFLFLFSIH